MTVAFEPGSPIASRASAADPSPGTLRAFHEHLLEHLADGVYFVDRDRTINYWNRGAERLTGYASADVVGRRCQENLLAHVDAEGTNLCRGRCPLVAAVSDGRDHETMVWLRHRDGSRRPVRVRTSPVRDETGAIVGAVEVFDDSSALLAARDEAEAALRDALLDPLTGLPNRRYLDMMLAARAEDLALRGTPFAVLLADIDHFKHVNDRFGHAVGDAALRVVAETLRGAVRASDFAGRWGGEEFLVVAQQTDVDTAAALAERLRALVASASVPLRDDSIGVTISIGVAATRPGEAGPAVVARADRALYTAKRSGRNRVALDR